MSHQAVKGLYVTGIVFMSGFPDKDLPITSISQPQLNGVDYPLRVLLYSHDSVGLGHLRRNLAIANEIATVFPNSSILIVTGSPCATQFQLPANTDLIKIPSISKNSKGQYFTRNFSGSLETAIEFRSKMILEAYRLFKPGLVIVDHQLLGLKGEALGMLREAKKCGTITIYGSRDVKDSPDVVKRHWNTADCHWALTEGYDQVCVYGMPEVFDPRVAYAPFLDTVKQLDFTGYIVPKFDKPVLKRRIGQRKKVLVTFGGGGDGARRAECYLRALSSTTVTWDSHIITGPLMDAEIKREIRKLAKKIQPIGSVRVQRFNRNIPALLQQVDAVVSMAGYNSCAEILQSGTPAVLLPRSFPRKEQLIRATRMAELGWMTVLPEAKPDPQVLLKAVERALVSSRQNRPEADLNGLGKLSQIILEQLQTAGLAENMPQLAPMRGRAI